MHIKQLQLALIWCLPGYFFYLTSSQTGAIDRSQDIMMQIDHTRLRDCESLYTPEKLVRHYHPDQHMSDLSFVCL